MHRDNMISSGGSNRGADFLRGSNDSRERLSMIQDTGSPEIIQELLDVSTHSDNFNLF